MADRLGDYVTTGTELAEVDDTRIMRARIYVSEHEMYKYRPNSVARLQVDGTSSAKWFDAVSLTVSPTSSESAPGLLDLEKFKGMRQPTFYAIDLVVKQRERQTETRYGGHSQGLWPTAEYCRFFATRRVADFAGRKLLVRKRKRLRSPGR